MLTLASGDWQAELRPEIGGSLSALRWRGVDVLRPMPPDASDPLQSACFPLVPYCNHTPDALNRAPAEMTVLPPGCTASLTMWISAGERSAR